jgi:hypothetical protein
MGGAYRLKTGCYRQKAAMIYNLCFLTSKLVSYLFVSLRRVGILNQIPYETNKLASAWGEEYFSLQNSFLKTSVFRKAILNLDKKMLFSYLEV